MADGTPQNGTATVAADEITTDNGATVSARQAQRIKIDSKGVDGAVTDASAANPFPVYKPNRTSTGVIGALNATVSLALDGDGDTTIEVVNTVALVGTIVFELRMPGGTNWWPANGTASSTSGPVSSVVNPANALYRLTAGSAAEVRIRISAYTSGSLTIIMASSGTSNGIFANQILPVKIDQTTLGTTNAVAVSAVGTTAVNAFPAGFKRVIE